MSDDPKKPSETGQPYSQNKPTPQKPEPLKPWEFTKGDWKAKDSEKRNK